MVLLNIWAKGAFSEIFFYAVAAVLLFPFAFLDAFISRKISALKLLPQTEERKFNRYRTFASILFMLAAPLGAGIFLQFVFHLDIFQSDFILLGLFVLAFFAFAVSMCAFDLIRYLNLKKLLHESLKAQNAEKDGGGRS